MPQLDRHLFQAAVKGSRGSCWMLLLRFKLIADIYFLVGPGLGLHVGNFTKVNHSGLAAKMKRRCQEFVR